MNSIKLRPVTQADWLKFHAAHALPQKVEPFLAEQQARPAEQRLVALRGQTALGIMSLSRLAIGRANSGSPSIPFPMWI